MNKTQRVQPLGSQWALVMKVTTTLAIFVLLVGVCCSGQGFVGSPQQSSATTQHLHIQLASSTTDPYIPGELWGSSNPAERCTTCTDEELVESDTAQSIQSGQLVDPMTGDDGTSIDVVPTQSIAGGFGLTLSYDAQRAYAESLGNSNDPYQNGNGGPFGWGWQSTADDSEETSSDGSTWYLNEPGGAQAVFTVATADGCPTGGDEDYQKYTVPESLADFCGPYRLDAQLGVTFAGYELSLQGGQDIEMYNGYGQLVSTGDIQDPAAVTYAYVPSSSQGVPASCSNLISSGITECFVETDVASGRTIVVGSGGTASTTTTGGSDFGQPANDIVDPDGNLYQLTYDSSDDLSSVQDPYSHTTQWMYQQSGSDALSHQMSEILDPDGDETDIQYGSGTGMVSDVIRKLVTSNGTTSYSTSYTYTQNGCVTSTTDFCVTETNTATVAYPDGETDVDTYNQGQLGTNCYGTNSTNCWGFSTLGATSTDQEALQEQVLQTPTGALAYLYEDSAGDIVQYTDPLGNTTNYMYNDNGANNVDSLCWSAPSGTVVPGNATCATPPPGSTSYTYAPLPANQYDGYGTGGNDGAGDEVTSETDALGNTTHYGYYSDGELCWEAAPTVTGTGSSCGSTPSGAPTGSTAYQYDSEGDTVSTAVDYGDGSNTQSTTGTFDADNRLQYSIPPVGQSGGTFGSNAFETGYQYYANGWVRTKTQPQPIAGAPNATETTYYNYTSSGLLLSSSNAAATTTNQYDTLGRLCWTYVSTSATSPTNACISPPAGSTSYTYNVDTGAYLQVTDPNGDTTKYAYADNWYPTKATTTTDEMGTQVQYAAYDDYGNTCVSGPVSPGSPTSCSWLSGDTYDQYNPEGQLLEQLDPSDIETTYAYSNRDFPVSATQVTYDYNTVGNPEETTKTTYDADGNPLIEQQVQGNTTVSLGYHADGRVCWRAPVASLASCSSPPSGNAVSIYRYNNDDELATMVDNSGTSSSTTDTYSYDNDGSLTSATDDNGRHVGYQYNAAEEVSCIAYPLPATGLASNCGGTANATSNLIVNRAYNAAGQLASVTDWNGNVTSLSGYNQLSEVGSIAYPSGTGESVGYGYYAAGDLQLESYTGPAIGSESESWTYNSDEELASESGAALGGFTSPSDTYNSYKGLAGASNPISAGTSSVSDAYSYNADGTIKTDTPSGGSAVSFNYNSLNELTSTDNPNATTNPDTSFAYTAEGQRCWSDSASSNTSAPCSSAPSGATSYGWDAYGELCWSGPTTFTGTSCQSPPPGTTGYTYSGMGLRTSETPASPGTALSFSWDTVDGGGTPLDLDDGTNYYIYGASGTAPIEQLPVGATSTPAYLSSSPSGVQTVFSQSGALEERAVYTAFGTQVLEGGTHEVTPFGFQSSYTDPSGLVYLINRYYDPATDQFLSVDPALPVTLQPYAVEGDDPLNQVDPLGLESVSAFLHWCNKDTETREYCAGLHEIQEADSDIDKAEGVLQDVQGAADLVAAGCAALGQIEDCAAESEVVGDLTGFVQVSTYCNAYQYGAGTSEEGNCVKSLLQEVVVAGLVPRFITSELQKDIVNVAVDVAEYAYQHRKQAEFVVCSFYC